MNGVMTEQFNSSGRTGTGKEQTQRTHTQKPTATTLSEEAVQAGMKTAHMHALFLRRVCVLLASVHCNGNAIIIGADLI
jgi:hypothetical protein